MLKLTETSPAQTFTEPVTLAVAKQFLRVPVLSPTDSEQDSEIEALIAAAREIAEGFQNRDLVDKQWDLTLDYFASVEIDLREQLSSVDLVRYKDSDGTSTDLTESTDYIVDLVKGLIRPPYGEDWPSFTAWPTSAVTIRFSTSPERVHENVKTGIKLLVSDWYYNRLPRGLSGDDIPMQIQALLRYGAVPRIY